MRKKNIIVITAAILIVLYWIVEAFIDDVFFYGPETFSDMVSLDIPPHELYSRLLFIAGLVCFAYIARRAYAKIEAEHKTAVSEKNRIETTLDSIADAVIAADTDCRVTGMNPVAESLTGYTFEQAKGKKLEEIFDIVNEYTGDKVKNPAEKVLQTGNIIGLANHTALISADGTVRSIADSGSPIRDAEGNIAGVVIVFRDVTDERRSHLALMQSEQRFRSIIENSKDGIGLQDDNGIVLEWNRSMEAMFGLKREDVIGKHSTEVIDMFIDHEDNSMMLREKLKANVAWALAEGKPDKLNRSPILQFTALDGIPKSFEQHHFIMPFEDGSRIIASTYRDVTEKKQKEREIIAGRERLSKVFALSPGMIWILDLESGTLIDVNDTFLEKFKIRRENVIGKPGDELNAWVNHNDRKLWLDTVLAGGEIHEFETQLRTESGDLIFVLLSGSLIEINGKRCIITYATDISERKRYEAKLQRYQVELELRVAERTKELEEANVELEQINAELTREFQERRRMETALRESEQNYRTMITQLPIGVYRSTVDGILKNANPALATILGFDSTDELQDFTVYDFYDKNESRIALIEKQKHASGVVREELELRRKDGKKIWVRDTGKVITDDDGFVLFTDGVIEDITEMKLADTALKQSEERYRLLFEKLTDIFFRVDADGTISVLSPSVVKVLGMTPDELCGKPVETVINDSAFINRLIEGLKSRKGVNNIITSVANKDGKTVYFAINAHIYKDKITGSHGVEGIARDITNDVKYRNYLSVQYSISKASNSVDSLEELYLSIHESLKTIVEADNFFIAIFDADKNRITFPRITDEYNETETEIESSDSRYLTTVVIKEDRTIIKKHDEVDTYYKQTGHPEALAPQIWVGIPLRIKNKVIGAISVKSYKSAKAYSREDISILESISDQIAVAIDRKQASMALKNQYQFMQKLIDTIPNPVYYKEAAGRTYKGCNHAYEKTVGISRDFIIGKTVYDLFPYEDAIAYEQKDLELLRTGGIQQYDDTFIHSDGSVSHHVLFRSCYADQDGEVTGLVGIILDITGIKLAEEAARRAQEHAEMIYKVTPSCIFTVDKKRNITSWNERVASLTGFEPEEVIDKYCDFCPHHGEEQTCVMFDKNVQKPVIGFESIITTKTGERRIISKNIDLLRNSLGEVIGGIESFEDITDRKRIEEELFRQATSNSTFAELSRMIISTADQKQITDIILEHGLRLTGAKYGYIAVYDRKSGVLGMLSWHVPKRFDFDKFDGKPAFRNPSGLSAWVIEHKKTLLTNNARNESVELSEYDKLVDSDRFIIAPAVFGDELFGQIGFSASATDFTEQDAEAVERLASLFAVAVQRRRAEEEIRTALDKELELNDLKSSFISMVSHEYRTPLQAIVMSTQLLSEYGDKLNPDSRKKYFDIISKSVKTMDTLLEDIITFNKAEVGKIDFLPENIDIEKFCLNFAYEMQYIFKDRNRIDLTVNKGNCIASLDEKIIRTILTNLISNAVKYSPAGIPVELFVDVSDTFIEFTVKDKGIGIPEEDQNRLFEPFFRGKNVGNVSGTGLGLSIAKNSVLAHGGELIFNSEQGKGTSFTAKIPFYENIKMTK